MKKILKLFLISLLALFAFGPVSALAQGQGEIENPGDGEIVRPRECDSTVCLENPFKVGDSLMEVLESIITTIVMPIGGVVAVLAFIYSGFLYVAAQGKPGKLENAHKALLYTVIGTALLLGAWTIANVIGNTISQLM